MKICYLADTQIPSRTANSVHVMRMCQAYADLGHDVTLVIPDWRDGLETNVNDIFEFYGVNTTFALRRVFRLAGRLDLLVHALLLPLSAKMCRPDLVHTRSLAAAWGATRLLRLPTVFEAHRPVAGHPRLRAMLRSVTSSPWLRTLVLITRALAERFSVDLHENARLLIAPDGVDERWLKNPISREQARESIGLGRTNRPIAVYTGHLYQGRGVGLILDLAGRNSEYLFLVVGGRESEIEAFRHRASEIENVLFVGFRPPSEVLVYLRAADVLLMPYADRVETTSGANTAEVASPMKLFEYLAAGRPILASTLPVLSEILEHEHNALLLPYDDVSSWSAGLERLHDDQETARRLGRQASRDARKYTWKWRAERILEAARVSA